MQKAGHWHPFLHTKASKMPFAVSCKGRIIAVPPLFTSAEANASLSITRTTRENLLGFQLSGSKATFHTSFLGHPLSRWNILSGRGMYVLLFFLAFSQISAVYAAALLFIIDGNLRFVKKVFLPLYPRFARSFLKRTLKTVLTKGCIKNSCVKNANGKFRHTSFNQFASSVQMQKPL